MRLRRAVSLRNPLWRQVGVRPVCSCALVSSVILPPSGLASAIAAAPVARHAVIDTLNITPPQLTTELIQELARVLEQDTASIDPSVPS